MCFFLVNEMHVQVGTWRKPELFTGIQQRYKQRDPRNALVKLDDNDQPQNTMDGFIAKGYYY